MYLVGGREKVLLKDGMGSKRLSAWSVMNCVETLWKLDVVPRLLGYVRIRYECILWLCKLSGVVQQLVEWSPTISYTRIEGKS